MLNCMRVVVETEEDLQECYDRLEVLEDAQPMSHEADEWNMILNGLLVWEIDHPGTVKKEWSQID